jgi:hypothetical protein
VPGPALIVEPDDLVLLADDLAADEFDALLARPAAGVELLLPDYDPADDPEAPEYAPALKEADRSYGWGARLILEEGVVAYIKAKFEESKHPRWPKGAPHGKGGKFMQIGERFVGPDGKPYEIGAPRRHEEEHHRPVAVRGAEHARQVDPEAGEPPHLR